MCIFNFDQFIYKNEQQICNLININYFYSQLVIGCKYFTSARAVSGQALSSIDMKNYASMWSSMMVYNDSCQDIFIVYLDIEVALHNRVIEFYNRTKIDLRS